LPRETGGLTAAGRPAGYDVIVVGGGAAGLSGALVLARARRSVLVVDSGEPRNAPAAHAHGFLSRDGIPPAELLDLGRAQVREYGGEVLAGRVTSAAPAPDGGFRVSLATGHPVSARRLLVATGLADELPDVPGVRERWGRDVLHCPYCHGWEVRDQAIGVLAGGPMSVSQALLFRQWSADVTLFLHTAPEPALAEQEQLAARSVPILAGRVAEIVVTGDQLTAVRLATGRLVPCQAVVVGPRFSARADVLISLGLRTVAHPAGTGSHVAADPTGLTAVPGVWVAGNITDLSAPLIGAAAGGSAAAMAINADLVAEDTTRACAYRRAGHQRLFPWDLVLRKAGRRLECRLNRRDRDQLPWVLLTALAIRQPSRTPADGFMSGERRALMRAQGQPDGRGVIRGVIRDAEIAPVLRHEHIGRLSRGQRDGGRLLGGHIGAAAPGVAEWHGHAAGIVQCDLRVSADRTGSRTAVGQHERVRVLTRHRGDRRAGPQDEHGCSALPHRT
jgi:thioredoxin reductase